LLIPQPRLGLDRLVSLGLSNESLEYFRDAKAFSPVIHRPAASPRHQSDIDSRPLKKFNTMPVLNIERFDLGAVVVVNDQSIGEHTVDIENHELNGQNARTKRFIYGNLHAGLSEWKELQPAIASVGTRQGLAVSRLGPAMKLR
jgi:hypothetical protein